jgi:hypothetical protein
LRVEGFGGTWSGTIEEAPPSDLDTGPKWKFHLSVDRMDAAELDRWVGPRARPSWLQRLLPSLLGGTASNPPASELVRRVNAEGELDIAELSVEKFRFEQVHAKGSLRGLQLNVNEGETDWAGGKVRASFVAKFLPRPSYDVTAQLERVNLAQVPGAGRLGERLSGLASGTLQLKTEGVGREELLGKLSGQGFLHLNKVELRGWDVNASVADGTARSGNSRWPSGEASFRLKDRNLLLEALRLDGAKESTLVNGTLTFGRDADLAIETAGLRKSKTRQASDAGSGHVLRLSGPLDGPKVSVERVRPQQPAD